MKGRAVLKVGRLQCAQRGRDHSGLAATRRTGLKKGERAERETHSPATGQAVAQCSAVVRLASEGDGIVGRRESG